MHNVNQGKWSSHLLRDQKGSEDVADRYRVQYMEIIAVWPPGGCIIQKKGETLLFAEANCVKWIKPAIHMMSCKDQTNFD